MQPVHFAETPRILDILVEEYHCDPLAQASILVHGFNVKVYQV